MANNNAPSIKDNPFKRLDALRTTTSADEPPRVPPRRLSSTSSVASRVSAFEAIGLHAPEPAAAVPSMDGTRCTAVSTFNAVEALGQLSLKPGSVVIRHASDGDWCEVTDCTTGKRGKVPASAIQEVRETTGGAAPTTTAPEKKKGYTYSSLPSLTGGPKRKIYKQPKKR